jgi:hypothetical protein
MHFYLDYYALVGGGWELHRTEVAERSYEDETGSEVLVFPQLSPVRALATSAAPATIQFDTVQYHNARARVIEKYQKITAAPVVWLQAVFALTQVDSVLYNYYTVNNGPVDLSSIRLDQPVYTNVTDGYGVFGSSARVTRQYPMEN